MSRLASLGNRIGSFLSSSGFLRFARILATATGVCTLVLCIILVASGAYGLAGNKTVTIVVDGRVLTAQESGQILLMVGAYDCAVGVVLAYFTRTSLKALLGSSMFRYIVRRLLYMIPVALGVSIISFMTMYAAGDPMTLIRLGRGTFTRETLEALRVYYGLDKPIPMQYLNWLANLLQFNFGKSLRGGQPVNLLIGNWFWETIKLQLISIVTALAISIPVGINSARKQYSKRDVAVTSFSLFGVSMPTFWFGVILIIVFSYHLGWFPSHGARGDPMIWWGNPILDQIAHLILPVTVLVYVSLAQNIRLIRANMMEVLRSDYILAARASGLSERKIIYKYALRNAISPVITFLGIALGSMIAGAPMTETVFSWPGLGRKFVEATMDLDYPVVMGITMIITIMTLVANLIVDLAYVYIDPRVRIK